ncbi:uncharacterized protein LOC114572991 isoform X1 [Perca flavescens]|uniref:uncharacterized protein LOC114572991 isoform X1 n=1 Tax=Perca flavescens TaxID=8167 RepID=UPI00106E4E08|nr:uncharacterized protein LOC114572991 isoform X1 [Perca flavescens]
MMAVWCTAGALLLVLLTGLSYSYPMQQGISWAVAPPSPSSAGASTGPSTQQFASSGPAPQPLGLSNLIRPGSFLPQYQAGELLQEQKSFERGNSEFKNEAQDSIPYQAGELFQEQRSFERGNSESETEEQGSMPPPGFVYAAPLFYVAPPSQGFNGGPGLVPYPYPSYDYMFLTGQYPPGTYTYTSNSFEQGKDSRQDAHYTRDNYPSSQQAKNIPYRHRTVRQASIGSAGPSGAATGQQQPYSGVGVKGSYSQPGRHRRGAPRAFMQKVG